MKKLRKLMEEPIEMSSVIKSEYPEMYSFLNKSPLAFQAENEEPMEENGLIIKTVIKNLLPIFYLFNRHLYKMIACKF